MAGQFSLKGFPEAMRKRDKCLFVPPTDGSRHPKLKNISVHFILHTPYPLWYDWTWKRLSCWIVPPIPNWGPLDLQLPACSEPINTFMNDIRWALQQNPSAFCGIASRSEISLYETYGNSKAAVESVGLDSASRAHGGEKGLTLYWVC